MLKEGVGLLLALGGWTRRSIFRSRYVFLRGLSIRDHSLGTSVSLGFPNRRSLDFFATGTAVACLLFALDFGRDTLTGREAFASDMGTTLPLLTLRAVFVTPLLVFSFMWCSFGLTTYFHVAEGLSRNIGAVL